MTRRLVIAIGALAAFSSTAFGQAPPAAKPAEEAKPPATAASPPAAAKPGAEVDALKPFYANWKCDSELVIPGAAAPVKTKTTIVPKRELGNQWYTYTYKVAKTKDFPGMEGKGVLGWDSSKKEYMFVGVDSMGGWIDLTAPSVSATEVKWSGTANMGGKQMPIQYDWSTDGKTLQLKMTAGGQPAGSDSCKK